MRVVFVDHTSEAGGAELALARVLRASSTTTAQCTLIVPASDSSAGDAFRDLPAHISQLRIGPPHSARKAARGGLFGDVSLMVRILRSAFTLLRSSSARKADVLVANTTRSSVYVALAALVMRKPYVVHIRDLIEPGSIGSAATLLMRRLVLPRASAVVANSRASLRFVEDVTSEKCVEVVLPSPSGLVLGAPAAGSRKGEGTTFGMVARLDPWKGQDLLIGAFADAFPEGDERLVLAGGPAFGHQAYADQLRSLATARGVASRVEFLGHVANVTEVIAGFDVCVQSSVRPEPLGQNVLQYLASGKATIVSREGGPVEWVTDDVNGVTFEPRDRGSLAAAMKRLADDPELRASLGDGARATPGLLTDDEVVARLASVLRRVSEGPE